MRLILEQTAIGTEPSRILLQTQDQRDKERLCKIVPPDQSAWFRASWDNHQLTLDLHQPTTVPAEVNATIVLDPHADLHARVNAMSEEDLLTELAVHGVKYNKQQSRETKVRNLVEAMAAKK